LPADLLIRSSFSAAGSSAAEGSSNAQAYSTSLKGIGRFQNIAGSTTIYLAD
jgi:hypothetical protein